MSKIICPKCGEPNNDINTYCLKCKESLSRAAQNSSPTALTGNFDIKKDFVTKIHNIENLTSAEINYELSNGAKFVIYEYCMSFLIVTVTRKSDIYFIKSDKSSLKHSLGFSLISLLLGWWGIPWGPINTIVSLSVNLSGGKDITKEVIAYFNAQS
jgi:hypothetical protein